MSIDEGSSMLTCEIPRQRLLFAVRLADMEKIVIVVEQFCKVKSDRIELGL